MICQKSQVARVRSDGSQQFIVIYTAQEKLTQLSDQKCVKRFLINFLKGYLKRYFQVSLSVKLCLIEKNTKLTFFGKFLQICRHYIKIPLPIALVSSLLAFSRENLNFALTSLFGQLTKSKYNDRQSLLSSSNPFGFTLRHLKEMQKIYIF